MSLIGGYFTQVMGNSTTAGKIEANGLHPSDSRMINSHITISENAVWNASSIYSSTGSYRGQLSTELNHFAQRYFRCAVFRHTIQLWLEFKH